MTLDITKPVQTRDGRSVRILCTDKKGEFPIVALVTDENDKEFIGSYSSGGRYFNQGCSDNDLVNVPERVERWLNIYPPSIKDAMPSFCSTKELADNHAGPHRIGILHIIYEDARVWSTSYKAV
jgi:hypothetical protein